MPALSVVVPVYNSARTLARCLDSLLGQSMADVEILCVDDGSSDGSGEILRRYAAQDARLRCITLPVNAGPSVARNAGMALASGDYVGFVDSDDYVEPDFYAQLLNEAHRTRADIVKGHYRYQPDGLVNATYNTMIRQAKTNLAMEFCSCIFLRDFLQRHALRFPEDLRDMEDPLFAFSAALVCNRVALVDTAYINIVRRADSATAEVPDMPRIRAKFAGLRRMFALAHAAEKLDKDSYSYVLALWFVVTLNNVAKNAEGRAWCAEKAVQLYADIRHPQVFLQYANALSPAYAKSFITASPAYLVQGMEKTCQTPCKNPPALKKAKAGGNNSAPKRLLLFCHYNKYDGLSEYVVYLLSQIRPLYARVVLVSNSRLSASDLHRLDGLYDDFLPRANVGFDFGAWRDALFHETWETLLSYDSVTLMNDTCFGPLFELAPVYARMEAQGADFWGMTKHRATPTGMPGSNTPIPEHIQSYFLCFKKNVVASDVFQNFWHAVQDEINKWRVIARYETQLTDLLRGQGFAAATVFDARDAADMPANVAYLAPHLCVQSKVPFLKVKAFTENQENHFFT